MNRNSRSCTSLLLLLTSLLAACGGESGSPSPLPRDDAATSPAPQADAGVGQPTGPGAVAPPDGGAAPSPASEGSVPVSSSCPDAKAVAGSYAGSFTGSVVGGSTNLAISGTLSFTLVPGAGPDELAIQDGKVGGVILLIPYSLPLKGSVKCGQLDSSGGGDILGVKFGGVYQGAWSAGGFPAGTWSGSDDKKTGTASGSWSASKK
jgi:hypothetical protein